MKHTLKIFIIMLCLVLCSMAVAMPGSRLANDQYSRPTNKIATRHTVPYFPGARQTGVLFVEDPGNTGWGPPTKPDPVWTGVLDEILGAGNYGWFGPTENLSEDGPPLDTMLQYELVIWNSYDHWWDDTATLTQTDQTNLGQYMEAGGYVWLIGQDALWSGVPIPWMNTYFALAGANQDYLFPAESLNVHGLAEIDCISATFMPDYIDNDFFPDELIPEAYAHAVLEDVDTDYDVAIFYDAGLWISTFWAVDGRVQPATAYWDEWVAMVTGMLDAFGITGVAEKPSQTTVQKLQLSIAPDPLVKSGTINYTLPIAGNVKVQVYNNIGQHVITLVDGYKPAGSYKVTWNGEDARGTDVSNGVYFVRLTCGEDTHTANVVVVK